MKLCARKSTHPHNNSLHEKEGASVSPGALFLFPRKYQLVDCDLHDPAAIPIAIPVAVAVTVMSAPLVAETFAGRRWQSSHALALAPGAPAKSRKPPRNADASAALRKRDLQNRV